MRFYDDLLKGKIVAIVLIYTHCQYSCPLETARLVQVQRLLGDRVGRDIFFYSITLDPDRDTPEVLKAYAEKFQAGPGWLFLTGRKADIKVLGQKLGLLSRDDTPVNRDGHTPELMIGNVPTGQWMRNSAVDNPRFLATMIGGLLDGWRSRPRASYASAQELAVSKGEYLFSTRCAACHTVGHGDRIGPDLLGVTSVRNRAWLARFIASPDEVLGEGDPIARALYAKYRQITMPNLRLGPDDVAALIDHLAERSPDEGGSVVHGSAESRASNDDAATRHDSRLPGSSTGSGSPAK